MIKVSIEKFLQTIMDPVIDQGKWIEISRLENTPRGKKISTRMFELRTPKLSTIAGVIEMENKFNDVYFGVCPREEPRFSETGNYLRSTNSHVALGCVVWIDLDAKRFSNDIVKGKALALKKVKSLRFQPNIIVDSGNGYHLYFLLDQPYPVEDVSYTCKRLEVWLGADHCHDPARILRVPGTLNRKDPNHVKPSRIIHFDDANRFRLDDFDCYPNVDDIKRPKHMQKIALSDEVKDIDIEVVKTRFADSKLYAKIMADFNQYKGIVNSRCPSRSERDFHVCCQLIKSGFEEDEIHALFAKYPVGEKYREEGPHGRTYLTYTIEAAHRAVVEEQQFRPKVVQKNPSLPNGGVPNVSAAGQPLQNKMSPSPEKVFLLRSWMWIKGKIASLFLLFKKNPFRLF